MQLKSVFRRGADDGLIFGVYQVVLFLAIVYGSEIQALAFIGMLLFLLIPFVIYFFLRRCYLQECGTSSFSSLWMLGILIFFYGSLICGMVTYIWLEYVEPDYIYKTVKSAIGLYEQMPAMEGSEMLEMMRKAVENRMLPTPIEFVFSMLWSTTFFGSLLSMLESLAARIKGIGNKEY